MESIVIEDVESPDSLVQKRNSDELDPIDMNRFYFLHWNRFGNMILLYGRYNTTFPFQILIGPHWYFMIITFAFIVGLSFLYAYTVMGSYHVGISVAVFIVGGITFVAYSCTAFSDPGIVFESYVPENEQEHTVNCAMCKVRRPSSAMHCFDCQVCVEELDHHCPWTGKCIGKKNLSYFYAFTGFMFLQLIVVMGLIVYRHVYSATW